MHKAWAEEVLRGSLSDVGAQINVLELHSPHLPAGCMAWAPTAAVGGQVGGWKGKWLPSPPQTSRTPLQRFLEVLRELSKGEEEAIVKEGGGGRNHLISGYYREFPVHAPSGRAGKLWDYSGGFQVPASATKAQCGQSPPGLHCGLNSQLARVRTCRGGHSYILRRSLQQKLNANKCFLHWSYCSFPRLKK